MTRTEQIQKAALEYVSHKQQGRGVTYIDFVRAVEWADKTMVERVLNFIFENFYDHPHANGHICTDAFDSLEELEEELIKVMEE